MYLKSIEVYGFKSFCNKIKIPLKPGITCIVGPNGCGKSNVVDSVRWCIGEMSWKSLRLPSMLDVIFSGTAKRQPMNIAEVSMTFDNESKKLPFDFTEVAVTRKIYRSEESEYFINRVQCRLKDIREMFLDTGIGSDGYAIIDQGGVEFVLSANPEERREIFEEAAGVSKYKAKREEAVRKLEKVDQDLARLYDSMALIDEQLKKLESEARKARLQQKYTEELKKAEVSLIVREISSYKKEIDAENANLAPVNSELQEMNSAITAVDAEISALNLNLTQKQEDERILRETVSSIKSRIARLEEIMVRDEQMIKEALSRTEELKTIETQNAESFEKIAPELEDLAAKKARAEIELPSLKADMEAVFERLKKIEDEISSVNGEAEGVNGEVNRLYQSEMDISTGMSRTNSDISHSGESILTLEKELEQLRRKSADIQEKISKAKAHADEIKKIHDSAGQTVADMEAEINRLESEISAKNAEIAEIHTAKARIEAKLETITLQSEKDIYLTGTSSVLNSEIQGVRGTLRHLINVRKEDRSVMEEAFGKFLDSVVVETAQSAREAIDYLRHLGKGRCRFLILENANTGTSPSWNAPNAAKIREKISCHSDYDGIISLLLNDVFVSGGTVMGPFWMAGGADEIFQEGSPWDEEDLRSRTKSLEDGEKSLVSGKAEITAKLAETEKELGRTRENLQNLSMELHKTQIQMEEAAKELDMNVQNIDFETKTLEKEKEELRTFEQNLSGLQSQASAVRKELGEKKAAQARSAERRNALQAEYPKIKEEIGVKKTRLENFDSHLEWLKLEVTRRETEKNELLAEKERISSRKTELAQKIAGFKLEAEDSKNALAGLRGELGEKEILEKRLSIEITDINTNRDSLLVQIKERREVCQELETRKHAAEIRLNSLNVRITDLEKRLTDEWNMDFMELKSFNAQTGYAGAVPEEVDEERVKYLRKRLENMGPVNMTAPEEYDAMVNRYNFTNSHVEDLNRAKNDLKLAISKINETTKENFKNTFEKVREHFRQIYGILFDGGEADLILTVPDNVLETGVEIMAHPPGKRLVSISQLSGGEKALTALALLFSFFCVNPSPFCIMDEADAALDEANIERFARLIREFSKSTQFLIITHNKRTMECADVLYGVTMEELGVSKLISVDLKRASALAEQQEATAVTSNR
ncbi:MAG: chromosome segregation protein SMC [Elusimicrobia bacterium]|nr:chromosome segregation protein SMC [Elusimicrobiota bacterium]